MKNKFNIKNTIAALMLGTLFISGCGLSSEKAEVDKPPQAISIAIANTSNVPAYELNAKFLEQELYNTIRYYGSVSVISVDGKPSVFLNEDYDIEPHLKKASDVRLAKQAKRKLKSLKSKLETVVADDAEVDYLAALKMCATDLGTKVDYQKKVYLMGSGLSSTGRLTFVNQEILAAEPESIVKELKQTGDLPNLKGCEVVWIGMTNTCAPQEDLSEMEKRRVADIWKGIVEASGAKLTIKDVLPSDKPVNIKRPYVTPVKVAEKKIVKFAGTGFDPTFSAPLDLAIDFIPNSAEVMNPEQVKARIKPIADAMRGNNQKIVLAASIAGDVNTPKGVELSRERALTVRNIFKQFGLQESNFICCGLGVRAPWHEKGLGVEDQGQVNRKCVIINADSDYAQKILSLTDM